jgi:hypothetical protein
MKTKHHLASIALVATAMTAAGIYSEQNKRHDERVKSIRTANKVTAYMNRGEAPENFFKRFGVNTNTEAGAEYLSFVKQYNPDKVIVNKNYPQSATDSSLNGLKPGCYSMPNPRVIGGTYNPNSDDNSCR